MATLSKKFNATLSNSYNSNAVAYQGCYSSSSKGATATNRKGYLKFSGLGALHGYKITKITLYLNYASAGNSAKKKLTFTTPPFSFTSGVVAYNKNETRTLAEGEVPYSAIMAAINGSGALSWTLDANETKTTINASSSGSYSDNYLSIDSANITVYYEEPSNIKVWTTEQIKYTFPEAPMTSKYSQNCQASASSEYSSSYPAWRAFDGSITTNAWESKSMTWDSSTPPNCWVQLIFPKALYNIEVKITNRNDNTSINGPTSYNISGTNNGSDTTLIASGSRDGATAGAASLIRCNNTTAYTGVRVNFTNWSSGSGTYCAVGDIEIFGYDVPSTGGWKEITPYVYTSGAWTEADMSIYSNSEWKS